MIDQLQQMTREIERLERDLEQAERQRDEALASLHKAGMFAGKQAAAITKALQHIEQAHQALHEAMILPDDEIKVLRHLANAMEALA
jgi:hypothetical protein